MTPTLGALHGKSTRSTRQGERIRPHDLAPRDRIAVLESRVARLAARYGTLLDADPRISNRFRIPPINDPAADLVRPTNTCAVDECPRKRKHWGLCLTHYDKLVKQRKVRP